MAKHADIRRARPLLGTLVEIAAGHAAPRDAERAIEAAFAAVARTHRLMSFHDPDSDVSRLNREAVAEAVTVDAWTWQVLQAALDLHRRSDGLFDIAVAPALQAIGLLPRSSMQQSNSASIATSRFIELLSENRVRFRHPGLRIDLGGIAKGYAVDRAVEALQGGGMTAGIVNAGGDLSAFGPNDHSIWLRDPARPSKLLLQLQVRDRALASTGQRFDPFGGTEHAASAVIDPVSRKPARGICGATVRAPSCMMADALTKIVMLAGERSEAMLDHYHAGAIFVTDDGGLCVTADWQEAVRLAA